MPNVTPTARCTSISLGRKTKDRLDAISLAGRRSRTATVELLMDAYLSANPTLAGIVQDVLDNTRLARLQAQQAQQAVNS